MPFRQFCWGLIFGYHYCGLIVNLPWRGCARTCEIIPLQPGLGGEAEATAREHAVRRDAPLQPFGRAREKGMAHWPVTRICPVVHLRERTVTV